MKRLGYWILLSLLIHAGIFTLLLKTHKTGHTDTVIVEIRLLHETSADEVQIPESVESPAVEAPEYEQNDHDIDDTPRSEEVPDALSEHTGAEIPPSDPGYDIRRARFLLPDEPVSSEDISKHDPLDDLRKTFVFDKPAVPPQDEISDMLRSRFDGSDPSLFTIKPVISKIVQNNTKFDFTPTEVQLKAMHYLYENNQATQIDLYPSLGADHSVTAAQFDQSMNVLVEKGFVSREKISPENIFMIATPIGGLPLEVSGRNRRNPVYRYKPLVDKGKLSAFIQSLIFEQQKRLTSQPADSARIQENIDQLKNRLQVLLNL